MSRLTYEVIGPKGLISRHHKRGAAVTAFHKSADAVRIIVKRFGGLYAGRLYPHGPDTSAATFVSREDEAKESGQLVEATPAAECETGRSKVDRPTMALYLMRAGGSSIESGDPDASDKEALDMLREIEAGELEIVIRKAKRAYSKENRP